MPLPLPGLAGVVLPLPPPPGDVPILPPPVPGLALPATPGLLLPELEQAASDKAAMQDASKFNGFIWFLPIAIISKVSLCF